MSVETISDETLVRFCENIRQRAEADRAHKQNFATGPTYAEKMQMARPSETIRRLVELGLKTRK